MDLTAAHTGAFSGVSNTLATVSSFVSPLLGGRLLDGSRTGWANMFFCIACLNLASAGFWVWYASGDSLDDALLAADRPGSPDRNSPRTVADDVLLEDVSPKPGARAKRVVV